MELDSPKGMDIEFEEDEMGHAKVKPNPDEQLPLDVCSNDRGCFIYDANGAEVGYWDENDWADDPKLIVWMVEQMYEAYESPRKQLEEAAKRESMLLFYDREYPNDDVVWKSTNEATFGPSRELPPLGGRDRVDVGETPLSVQCDDRYAEDTPSLVQIHDGETILKEWSIEHSEDEAANRELGAEVAWNIRLAYERPWELRG